MAMNEAEMSDPRGEVISKFQVYWNDPSPKRVVVLQFPNRTQDKPYNARNLLKPTRMRWKPKSGFIEIEVPLKSYGDKYFNDSNASDFARQLTNNPLIQEGGNFGLAGGFGIGGVHVRAGQRARNDAKADDDQMDQSVYEEGDSLTQLTLAGKVQQFKEGDPMYAMASFKGDEIHLTRIHAICSLSPYHAHLDAAADNLKASRMRQAESGAPEPEARAINISLRTSNVENPAPDDIGQVLRDLQEETWQEVEWIDEDDDRSYGAFQDHLFHNEAGPIEPLVSNMSPLTYLSAISTIKNGLRTAGQNDMQELQTGTEGVWNESSEDDYDVAEAMQE